jgi:uncharacterized protein YdeI (YjbR/CyaY-like superfamily)
VSVTHFRTAAEFRRWLQKNHGTAREVWVGFYRKGCGKTGMSYPEAVDQALCFGWIDGVRKKIDEFSYTNRFSPRTAKSTWSLVNIRRVKDLEALGLMAAPGRAAFEGRDAKRSGTYSFENRPASLPGALQKIFMAKKDAWAFFMSQPPGYRRVAIWWVISAVKDDTRRRRLATLIDDSARGRRLGLLTPASKESS